MAYEFISTERRGSAFILTLDRPEKRNAVNSAMWAEISQALDEFEADDGARVLVLTNTGPCFCAGSDLVELREGAYRPPAGRAKDGFAGFTGRYLEKPTIAAVEGMCKGGGAEILLACDLAVVSDDCVIGYPEVKRNLLAAGGAALLRQAQAIPVKRAMELLLTGDDIDAGTALAWGVVNRVVPRGSTLDAALELAAAIARNAPIAIRETKRLAYQCINQGWSTQGNLAWDAVAAADLAIKETEDAAEGEAAFAEKREPHWSGR